MSFSEAIKSVFSKYATFSGRARCSEYWCFVLLSVAFFAVVYVLMSIFGDIVAIIAGIVELAILVPYYATIFRRLHDIGKSGAWIFIILVPLVGLILLFMWLATDSQPGDNQYGPNPKAY